MEDDIVQMAHVGHRRRLDSAGVAADSGHWQVEQRVRNRQQIGERPWQPVALPDAVGHVQQEDEFLRRICRRNCRLVRQSGHLLLAEAVGVAVLRRRQPSGLPGGLLYM